MAVLISMLTLVPGGMGGSETYARELVRELAQVDLDVSTLVSPVAAGFSGTLREQVATEYPAGASMRARSRALAVGTVRRRQLTRRMAAAQVVHYPFTVTMPPPAIGQASVVSLLDVQHHDLPALFSPWERAYRHRAYDAAARRADAVITISAFAKDRIVRHLGIDQAKVHVAHLGVRPEEFPPSRRPREPFLLYPARGWAHKNHVTLFEAFGVLRRRHPSLSLVLTGATPAELPTVPAGVELRGQVPRRELIELYGRASALVFPSRYEGFGLPVLEAMAAGCPVASAEAASLPEVVGDAAVLFDPLDVAALCEAVEEALDRGTELARRGAQRAARFNWAACAQIHVGAYRGLGG